MKIRKASLLLVVLLVTLISITAVSATDDFDEITDIANGTDDVGTLQASTDEVLTTDEHSDGEGYIDFTNDSVTVEEGQNADITGTLYYSGGEYDWGSLNVNCNYTDGNGIARSYSTTIGEDSKLNFDLSKCEGLIASATPYILKFSAIEDNNYDIYLQYNNNKPLAESWVSLTVTAQAPVEEDDNMTIYVGPDGVDADGYGLKDKPYKTIKYATTKAIDNQKIFIYAGIYNEAAINLYSKPYRNLTFIGENRNVVIKGSTTGRTFDSGSTKFSVYLKFINLTITGAKSGTSNAIFDLRQNTGTNEFINCTIEDSEGIYGIYSGGRTLIDRCQILNHVVTRTNGYGIWISSDGEHYITNTLINGVTKTASSSGYVISASKGILNINNLTMTSVNGIIYGINLASNSKAHAIINNSRFINSAFQGTYSAIFNGALNCNFTITNSIIANNRLTTGIIKGLATTNVNFNYNLIYNNTDYNDNTKPGNTISTTTPIVNTDYNYWGSNTPGLRIAGAEVTPNNWIVVEVKNTPEVLRNGESITITAQLKVNDTTGNLTEFDGTIAEIPVTFQYNGKTESGVLKDSTPAQATFTFDKNNPTAIITAVNQVTEDNIPVFTIYVGPNGTDEIGYGSKDKPFKTIAFAVSQANADDVINILEGRYDENSISLNKSLSFIGENENVVITSSAAKKVFDAAYSESAGNFDLRFEKITFESINSGSSNAILNLRNTGKTEIIDCVFENTVGQYNIWSASPQTIIENCEFKNIGYSSAGSIIYLSGSNGKQELKNITFNKISNSASGTLNLIYSMNTQEINIDTLKISGVSGKSNALSIANKNNVTVKNAEIINNEFKKQSDAAGGSIFSIAGSGNLEVTDSIIANNTVERGITVGTSNETVLTLNYNLIYNNIGNILYSGVKTKPVQFYDFNYNFWGNNNKPELTTNVGEVTLANWIVVETSHYPGAVLDGKEVTVSAQLKVKDNESVKDLEKTFLDLPISFTYNGNKTDAWIVDNTAGYVLTFNSSETNVSIEVMDAKLTETIEVKDPINYVSPDGNDTTGDGTKTRPFKTISKAIADAEDGFTIYLLEGTYDENSLALTKNLIFIGENAVITSSNRYNNIFTSGSINTNYTFVNLTFSSNNPDSNEIIILELQNTGKNEFENCKFENLTVKTIIESYAETVISDCEFTGNIVNYGSGSVGTQLIYLRGTDSSIVNTNITKNSYTPSSNYCFLIYTRGDTLIDNVLISENTGRIYGIYAYDSTVNIANSEIINNNMKGGANDGKSGGVIFTVQSRESTFNVTNTIISNNTLDASIAYGNNKNAMFILNYNVIANNTGKLTRTGTNKPTFNFNYNYWGSNTQPTEITIEDWIIVETTQSPAEVYDGENVTVIAQLKVMDSEGNVKELENTIPEIPITFEYNGQTITSAITNKAEATFVSDILEENVTVTLIDEKLTQTLNIVPVMHIYVNDTWIKLDNPMVIEGSKVNITVKLNDEILIENEKLSEGELTYIILASALKHGINTVVVEYGNEKYSLTTTETFEAYKVKPQMSIETTEINIGKDVNVTVKIVNATGDVTIIYDNTRTVVPLIDNVATYTINAIKAGTHTVTAIFDGDEIYENMTMQKTFEVDKLKANITIETTALNIGEDVNVTVKIENVDGEVTVIVDGDKKVLPLINNVATYTINAIKAGTHTVTALFMGNDMYDFAMNTTTFTVNKIDVTLDVKSAIINIGETAEIEVVASEKINGTLYVKINNENKLFEIENGVAHIDIAGLKVGTYRVSVLFKADDIYNACENNTATITVNAFDAGLNATSSDINVSENATINIEINKDVTGIVKVNFGNEVYPVTIVDGKGVVVIPGLSEGTYTAYVIFVGDEIFAASEVNTTFTVSKVEIPSDINISMEIPEGTTAPEFTINLPTDATGDFTITVDGIPYTEPLVNGSATVKVRELPVGNHTIVSSYTGDNKYDGFTSQPQNVTIPKATIRGGEDALNMTTPSNSATPSFTIDLASDVTGNLTVTVDGKDTYTQALVSGYATVTVSKLSSGKHELTVSYSGNEKYANISKTVTVNVPEPVVKLSKNKNINMLYSAGTKYQVLVTVDGKAKAGVKVAIKFNGKTKNVKTNKKGYAIYKIPTVKPKKYTITATYSGKTVKNTVKVNSIIKAPNKTVKKSKKVTKVKITLKKVNKKYLKNKTLKIKFNGKTYKVKTNKKGAATWKVKKSMVKKLKANKKYAYKVTYGKDVVTKKLTIKK